MNITILQLMAAIEYATTKVSVLKPSIDWDNAAGFYEDYIDVINPAELLEFLKGIVK